MFQRVAIARCAAIGASLAIALLAAGCGGGVGIEGPGFDKLGLSGGKNKPESKVPDRAPLVLPPDRARLPEPQPESAVAAAPPQNWPVDPERVIEQEEAREQSEYRKYVDKGDWSGSGGIDEFEKLSDDLERKKGLLTKDEAVGSEHRDATVYGDR